MEETTLCVGLEGGTKKEALLLGSPKLLGYVFVCFPLVDFIYLIIWGTHVYQPLRSFQTLRCAKEARASDPTARTGSPANSSERSPSGPTTLSAGENGYIFLSASTLICPMHLPTLTLCVYLMSIPTLICLSLHSYVGVVFWSMSFDKAAYLPFSPASDPQWPWSKKMRSVFWHS